MTVGGNIARVNPKLHPNAMSAKSIDLNCDMGEGFDDADAAMLSVISSANIATGTHAGSKERFARLATQAQEKNIRIGIHPGFNDPDNFGRKRLSLSSAEITALVSTEIDACIRLAPEASYVKVHGALANMAEEDPAIANAIARAVADTAPTLSLMGMTGLGQCQAAQKHNLHFINEIFADRAYTDDGFLTPRDTEGAVLHDAQKITDRIMTMLDRQAVLTQSGHWIPAKIDSICVHGDTQGAFDIAANLRDELIKAGYSIQAQVTP